LKLTHTLLLFAALLLLPVVASADSGGSVATYNVLGTLTITGNTVCSGPCTQTINFSFVMDYSLVNGMYVGTSTGTTVLSDSGPLGPFVSGGLCCSGLGGVYGYDDITSANHDVIDFVAGLTRANNAIVTLANDGSGTVDVFNGSRGTVHVVIDVNGYFE